MIPQILFLPDIVLFYTYNNLLVWHSLIVTQTIYVIIETPMTFSECHLWKLLDYHHENNPAAVSEQVSQFPNIFKGGCLYGNHKRTEAGSPRWNPHAEIFSEKYESVLTSALNKQEMSAEESLKIDLMLELITHLSSAQFAASYMQKDVVKRGS